MPEETFYVEGIQIAKRGIAMDIQKFLPDLAETRFVETFKAEPKPALQPHRPSQHRRRQLKKKQSQNEKLQKQKLPRHKPQQLLYTF